MRDVRRVGYALLLAAGVCSCASQQHPRETASNSEPHAREAKHEHTGQTSVAEAEAEDDVHREKHRKHETPAERAEKERAREARRAERADEVLPGEDGKERDNTALNERDRDGATLTPGDQSNDQSDLEITRRIREAVIDDDSLSFAAKNVKIITINGRVTLRGPVQSKAEGASIEKKALAVAGTGQVENQLEID